MLKICNLFIMSIWQQKLSLCIQIKSVIRSLDDSTLPLFSKIQLFWVTDLCLYGENYWSFDKEYLNVKCLFLMIIIV